MIISFLLSVSGFAIVMRIFREFADNFAFSKRLSTSLQLSFAVMLVGTYFFLHSHPFALWIFIGILLLSLNLFPKVLEILLIAELKKQILPLMDQVLLGLQTGSSFRVSLLQAIQNQTPWARRQHLEIYNSIVMNGSEGRIRNRFLLEVSAEFREMDRAQNKVVDHARAFRRQIKMEEDFRRRSGQVSQQIRLQALIVTFLYAALMIYIVCEFGFLAHIGLILCSSSLFGLGLGLIFALGRKMKWKL